MKYKCNNAGFCPKCGKNNLDYNTFEMENGNSGYFKWSCPNCGQEGEEWYSLQFIGHNIIDESGENIELEDNMIEKGDE